MPKLWTGTLETHKREVRDAVIGSTAALVAEHGLRGVTMSSIAAQSGIGRATLYKYFPDVESILMAWHETTIRAHLGEIRALSDGRGPAEYRLRAVLRSYALRMHERSGAHAGPDIAAMLHRGGHVDDAHRELAEIVTSVISAAVAEGAVRGDISAAELTGFCLNALSAPLGARSKASVDRAVDLTLAALR